MINDTKEERMKTYKAEIEFEGISLFFEMFGEYNYCYSAAKKLATKLGGKLLYLRCRGTGYVLTASTTTKTICGACNWRGYCHG
jgi:hypothetical protein